MGTTNKFLADRSVESEFDDELFDFMSDDACDTGSGVPLPIICDSTSTITATATLTVSDSHDPGPSSMSLSPGLPTPATPPPNRSQSTPEISNPYPSWDIPTNSSLPTASPPTPSPLFPSLFTGMHPPQYVPQDMFPPSIPPMTASPYCIQVRICYYWSNLYCFSSCIIWYFIMCKFV